MNNICFPHSTRYLWLLLVASSLTTSQAATDPVQVEQLNYPTVPVTIPSSTLYTGMSHFIRDDLTLTSQTYMRFKGTASTTEPAVKPLLEIGAADAESTKCSTVTISEQSGFYGSSGDRYKPSWLEVVLGKNGGSGKFIVQTKGEQFEAAVNSYGLWLESLELSANAKNENEVFDVLRMDGEKAVANVATFVNNNIKPARYVFNGGVISVTYVNNREKALCLSGEGRTTIFESLPGANVDLHKTYVEMVLNGGAGHLRFAGPGNVIFRSAGDTLGNNFLPWNLPGTEQAGTVEWDQTGDVHLRENCWLKMTADNALPYGPGKPNVVLAKGKTEKTNYSFLDLNGHTVRVNDITTQSTYNFVTNTAADADGTLVLGDGNVDSVLSVRCEKGVNVEKVGSGVLTIRDASICGSVRIRSGLVRFEGANRFDTPIVFDEGARVIGVLDESADTVRTIHALNVPAHSGAPSLAYVKSDEGTTYLYAGANLDGADLRVDGGVLAFTGRTSDKWWKFTVKDISKDSGNLANVTGDDPGRSGSLEFTTLALWSTNVAAATVGKAGMSTSYDYGPTRMLDFGGSDDWRKVTTENYSELEPGTFAVKAKNGYLHEEDLDGSGRDYSDNALFCGSNARCFNWINVGCVPGNETTWADVVFRLDDAVPDVSSYGLATTYWSTSPIEWRISSSSDGINWVVRDDHRAKWSQTKGTAKWADAQAISEYPQMTYAQQQSKEGEGGTVLWYNANRPYRFTHGGSSSERLKDVSVSVAENAVLDTRYVADDALSVRTLLVDCAQGGGTITKFAPAVGGELVLEGFNGTDLNSAWVDVPVTIETVVRQEVLETWIVRINGVINSNLKIRFKEGRLQMRERLGLIMVVR